MLVIIIKCYIFIICMLPVRTTLHSCLNTFAAFWRRSLGKLASLSIVVSVSQFFVVCILRLFLLLTYWLYCFKFKKV